MTILQAQPGGFDPMLMLLIMAVFFFFMIWPQMRRQKKAKTFVSGLAKGQHVVTTGGVHAKISQVNEKFFILDLEEGKMKVDPSAISMESTQAAYPAENKTEEKK